MKYRIRRHISTRASADRGSPDFERWLEFEEGETAELPDHVDVGRLTALGAIEAVKARAKKEAADG
jgi:hypothetical protein